MECVTDFTLKTGWKAVFIAIWGCSLFPYNCNSYYWNVYLVVVTSFVTEIFSAVEILMRCFKNSFFVCNRRYVGWLYHIILFCIFWMITFNSGCSCTATLTASSYLCSRFSSLVEVMSQVLTSRPRREISPNSMESYWSGDEQKLKRSRRSELFTFL